MIFNDYDVESTDWIEKLDDCIVEDEEVWELARQSKEEPNFENILITLRFQALERYVLKKFEHIEEVDYYTNCRDSHFYIEDVDGDTIEVDSIIEIDAINEAFEEEKC